MYSVEAVRGDERAAWSESDWIWCPTVFKLFSQICQNFWQWQPGVSWFILQKTQKTQRQDFWQWQPGVSRFILQKNPKKTQELQTENCSNFLCCQSSPKKNLPKFGFGIARSTDKHATALFALFHTVCMEDHLNCPLICYHGDIRKGLPQMFLKDAVFLFNDKIILIKVL